MQRLEELMQWQRQQQEKLVRHQQEQKALMTFEQKRLFQEIGSILDQGKLLQQSDENHLAPNRIVKNNFSNEEVKTTDHENVSSSQAKDVNVSFDEVPVKQVGKDFNQLLQEKLRLDEIKNTSNNSEKPKKKFLKKGEGLARFRMPLVKKPLLSQTSVIKADSRSSSKRKEGNAISGTNRGTSSSNVHLNLKPTTSSNLKNQQSKLHATHDVAWSHSFDHPHSLPADHISSPKIPVAVSNDSKHEQDELHMFELLEQKAANSSLCSNSSVVTRFLGEASARAVHLNDSNKSPSQITNKQLNLLQKTINDASSQPPDINVYIDERSRENPSHLSNQSLYTFLTEYIASNPQLDHGNYGPNAYLSKPAPRRESPKLVSKKLSYNTDSSINQNASLRNKENEININKQVDDSCSMNFNNKKMSCFETAEDVPIKTPTVPSHQHVEEVVESDIDTFKDSQAWSDCSYSSCEEPDSEDENKVKNSVQQQHQQQELPRVDEECETNEKTDKCNQNSISAHREAITFKSALLKERLTELENEIEIFKKENTNLKKLKKQYESDVANFNKEKKEYEKVLKENTDKMQENILSERRKLARERQVFEKYCQRTKSQPNRQEREEIQTLKQQVAELQEELIRKDTRWSATQVRTRDRIRQLNVQISRLKEENEKLKTERDKIKKVRFLNPKMSLTSNTKVLHCINEKLGQLKIEDVENPIVIKNVVPRKRIPASVLSQKAKDTKLKDLEKLNKSVQVIPDLQSKQNLTASKDEKNNSAFNSNERISDSEESCGDPLHTSDDDIHEIHVEHDNDEQSNSNENEVVVKSLVYNAFYPNSEDQVTKLMGIQKVNKHSENTANVFIAHTEENCDDQTNSRSQEAVDTSLNKQKFSTPSESSEINNEPIRKRVSVNIDELSSYLSEADFLIKKASNFQVSEPSKKEVFVENIRADGTREKNFSDGRQEIWYPNGNVKKLSSDKLISKMIYYNGDVKEKYYADGIEKYYYAETKTWQTSYSDGREIVEFPNGQVESKMPNGTSEISYPNGCTLIKNVDGSEKWTLSDGTVVRKSPSGVKELLYPNGQKEIHSEDHKRREYPDGTVKFLYPDGTQETRYASGRIRRKDKDGNLVMDTTHS